MSTPNKFLKIYEKNYNTFLTKFENSQPEECLKLFTDFCAKFLPLPELWIKVINYVNDNCGGFLGLQFPHWMISNSIVDFYSEDIWECLISCRAFFGMERQLDRSLFDKLLNGKHFELNHHKYDAFTGTEESEKFILENLSFPHANLKLVLDSFEEYLGKPVTKEAQKFFQKNKTMFEKIKSNESDTKKWFDSLGETLNDRFIIQNVEARIAEEPKNLELWKLFILFLKKKNKRAAYEVYCRYCRLFLGEKTFAKDFEIWKGEKPSFRRNRYLDKMKFCKIPNIVVYVQKKFPPTPLHFQCHSLPPQNFVFPVSMINLMIQNSTGKILQKLYQTSKYFFYKTQKPLCHTFHLKYFRKSNFFENSLSLSEKNFDFGGLKKISIYHQLIVNHAFPAFPDTLNILSTILPKLNIENLCILKIKSQIISPQDYQQLTKNGNIEKIVLNNVKIEDENGTLATLEELFQNLSNASHIILSVSIHISSNSWNIFENFVKNSKIKCLFFPFCGSIDLKALLNFLTKNCCDNAKVFFTNADLLASEINKILNAEGKTSTIKFLCGTTYNNMFLSY